MLFSCCVCSFFLSLFLWQRVRPQNEFSGAHSTGKNGQIVLLISARTTPIRKLYSIFIVINWMSMSNRSTLTVWLFYCIITLTARNRTHLCFHRVFIHFLLYSIRWAADRQHTHTHSRVHFLSFFQSSKECWKKKTSCAQCRPNRLWVTRDIIFLHRKITENQNYSEHLFPPSRRLSQLYSIQYTSHALYICEKKCSQKTRNHSSGCTKKIDITIETRDKSFNYFGHICARRSGIALISGVRSPHCIHRAWENARSTLWLYSIFLIDWIEG